MVFTTALVMAVPVSKNDLKLLLLLLLLLSWLLPAVLWEERWLTLLRERWWVDLLAAVTDADLGLLCLSSFSSSHPLSLPFNLLQVRGNNSQWGFSGGFRVKIYEWNIL